MLESNEQMQSLIKKQVEKIGESNNLTYEVLLKNLILTSNRLIIEVENVENKILHSKPQSLNQLLIMSTRLELLIKNVKDLM